MRVRATTAGLASAFARREKLADQLKRLDAAIAAAGRTWSAEQGNVFPLRDEALRRAVAIDLDRETAAKAAVKS